MTPRDTSIGRGRHLPQTVLAAAIGALLILTVTAVTSRISVHFHQQRETRLIERLGDVYLDGLSAAVAPHIGKAGRAGLEAALQRVAAYYDGVREVRIVVRTPDGRIIGDLARDARAAAVSPPPPDADVPLVAAGDSSRVWVQRPLSDSNGEIAVLAAQLDLRPIRDARFAANLESLAANAVLAVALAGFGFFAIGRLLTPLKLLEEALGEAAAGRPRPIPIDGRPTNARLRSLLREYNRMVTALADRRQLQIALAERLRTADLGRLAATIAHEVRNPLAGMLNAVDTARRFRADPQVVGDSLDLLGRGLEAIARVVETTLSTHRPPAGSETTVQVDFDDLARLLAAAAERGRTTLRWHATLAAAWPIDATIVRQIVLNLTLNALNAAGSGGTVDLAVEETADRIAIAVTDDGPGLAESFAEPLRRLDLDWIDTTGGGIGLGVVIRAVASLDGRIDVGAGDGGGTRIVVDLPLRRDGATATAEADR